MSYKDQLLADLKKGDTITVIEAMLRYGDSNCRSQVHKLRKDGHDIRCDMSRNKTTGKVYGRYYLIAEGTRRSF